MNLEDLRVFKEVAREENITKAASNMNFVQSNVTTKIKRLEQHYKTKLFYRHKHGVTLTSTGKLLLSYVDKILHLSDEVEKTIMSSTIPAGTLMLGSMETTTATRLPKLLTKYHEQYPNVALSLTTGSTQMLIKAVLDRKIEGAFVAGPVQHSELEIRNAFSEELVIVSNTNGFTTEQLKNQTIIVFKSGCFYREVFEEWLKSKGIIPANIMELNTLDGIIGCIKAGLGTSLLTKAVVEQLPKNDDVIKQWPLPDIYKEVTTHFIYRKDVVKTPAFLEFLSMI